jgi:hypothetical protein
MHPAKSRFEICQWSDRMIILVALASAYLISSDLSSTSMTLLLRWVLSV